MNKFTESDDGIPAPGGVPVQQSYVDTLDALEDAKTHLDKSSRSLLKCFSSAESSNQQFIQARSELAELATVYMDMHFPLSVNVVRDLRNVFFLYTDYDVKKFKKNIRAMEKSVTEQATSSAMLSRVHGLLLSDLERLHIDTGKILVSIQAEAAQKRDDYLLLLENAQMEKKRFFAKKESYDADKAMYYKEKEFYDAERAKYLAERERCKADEEKYDAKAHEMRRESTTAELRSVVGLVGSGVGAALGAGALLAAAPVVVVVGGVGVIAGAAVAVGSIHDRYIAQDFEREATAKKETAKENGKRATQMGESATAQGEKAIANGEKATANAERAAANGEKALREGKRAADQAAYEARECEKAVQLIKNDMINSLTQFITAMEKVSQFLSRLASDIDSCRRGVTAARSGMDRMKEHLSLMRIYEGRIIKSCDLFEDFQVIVQARVDALPTLNGTTDAAASSKDWCVKHEARGRLQQQESRDILVRLYPAQFPRTKDSHSWHHTILKNFSWH